jgi:hypothetical protein
LPRTVLIRVGFSGSSFSFLRSREIRRRSNDPARQSRCRAIPAADRRATARCRRGEASSQSRSNSAVVRSMFWSANRAVRVDWLMLNWPKTIASASAGLGNAIAARQAAQQGLDAGEQHARLNRLGDVVVGTHFEAENLVEIFVTGGQHQNHATVVLAHARQTSKPSLPGSMTSRITRSGCSARMRASAVSPRGSMV